GGLVGPETLHPRGWQENGHQTLCLIDTANERDDYKRGGILHTCCIARGLIRHFREYGSLKRCGAAIHHLTLN
ncbi:MAG: hypothetical protein ABI414_10065, partial [Devosia sp.]